MSRICTDLPYCLFQFQELPPLIVSETSFETETLTVTQVQTVTVPAPANTRLAAFPTPEVMSSLPTTASSPRTTAVDIVTDEDVDPSSDGDGPKTVTVVRGARPTRRPARWFGGW